jgi:glyceraldehyde 3-phosphate dehydrogenase
VLRAIIESGRKDIEVVAINDLGPVETNAHLLRFDSVHGRFPHEVTVDGDTIDVGRGPIKVTAIANPAELPWKAGRRHRAGMHRHLHRKDKAAAHLRPAPSACSSRPRATAPTRPSSTASTTTR